MQDVQKNQKPKQTLNTVDACANACHVSAIADASPSTNSNAHAKQSALEKAFNEFNVHAEQLVANNQELIFSLTEQVEKLSRELIQERAKSSPSTQPPVQNNNRLSHLLSALPAGVLVLDSRGNVQEANPAAIDLLGGAFHHELVGQSWLNIIEKTIEPSIHTGQESRLKDGRVVSMSTCPLGNEPGQIILLMDVTETRFLQQSLERHQRLSSMGEMSAKVAHQIRTPLASALLYVSNLSKGRLLEIDRSKFVNKALSRLQHMENVVEDMLSFSRVGEIGQDIVALNDLIGELRIAMETHLEMANCKLFIDEMPIDIAICANRDALLGVLQNLISNAIQVTGEGGLFSLSIEPVTQHHGIPSVDIKMSDNGPGIDESIVAKIFEPFFTTRAQGTGLGLSVARAVVENHGGSIWVESTGDEGSTFIVRLPMVKSSDLNGISPT